MARLTRALMLCTAPTSSLDMIVHRPALCEMAVVTPEAALGPNTTFTLPWVAPCWNNDCEQPACSPSPTPGPQLAFSHASLPDSGSSRRDVVKLNSVARPSWQLTSTESSCEMMRLKPNTTLPPPSVSSSRPWGVRRYTGRTMACPDMDTTFLSPTMASNAFCAVTDLKSPMGPPTGLPPGPQSPCTNREASTLHWYEPFCTTEFSSFSFSAAALNFSHSILSSSRLRRWSPTSNPAARPCFPYTS
mmetsp:Transcript_19222/g.53812  ORF Transcript_19222/g.53812 Transcript_19222/m.53812 type:complete len:246 (-) Transcript_19222:231-968(-)